ncbi:hypothetical protein ACRAWD_19750 [Caulobacter segnis]
MELWSPVKPVSFIVSATRQENAPQPRPAGQSADHHAQFPGLRLRARPDGGRHPHQRRQSRPEGRDPQCPALRRHLEAREDQRPVADRQLQPGADRQSGGQLPGRHGRAVEAAFPDRFTRDADGNLTRIDTRAVNFAKRESEQIRWGFQLHRVGWAPPRRRRLGGWPAAARAARRRSGRRRPGPARRGAAATSARRRRQRSSTIVRRGRQHHRPDQPTAGPEPGARRRRPALRLQWRRSGRRRPGLWRPGAADAGSAAAGLAAEAVAAAATHAPRACSWPCSTPST